MRLGAERQRQHLVAEADAEDGLAAESTSLLDLGHRIFAGRGRIAGAVRQEDAVRLHRQDVLGAGGRRQHGDIAAGAREAAQDVALEAVIDGDDLIGGRHRRWCSPSSQSQVFSSHSMRWVSETSLARSMPTRPGQSARHALAASPRSNLPLALWAMTPLGMPLSRMRVVSARVSMPERPMMPRAFSHWSKWRCER